MLMILPANIKGILILNRLVYISYETKNLNKSVCDLHIISFSSFVFTLGYIVCHFQTNYTVNVC